jgi:hypothetical protein
MTGSVTQSKERVMGMVEWCAVGVMGLWTVLWLLAITIETWRPR